MGPDKLIEVTTPYSGGVSRGYATGLKNPEPVYAGGFDSPPLRYAYLQADVLTVVNYWIPLSIDAKGGTMVTQETSLAGLLDLIVDLRAREKEQEMGLQKTRRDIDAVQRALTLLRERNGLPIEEPVPRFSRESFEGKTQVEALVTIAEHSQGYIKVTEAKRILLEAGVLPRAKSAYQQVTSTLIRSRRFEKASPGQYRLIYDKD